MLHKLQLLGLLLTTITVIIVQVDMQLLQLPRSLTRALGLSGDHSLPDLLNSIVTGVGLTTDRLLRQVEDIPIEEDVTFWCLNRNTEVIFQTGLMDEEIEDKINTTKPVVLIIHGWLDNFKRDWVQDLMSEFIKYLDVNVCGVDWSRLALYEYSIAAREHVFEVGWYLAVFILHLEDMGVSLDDISLVGHSLGAQIAGDAGGRLAGKLGAIYALDPAGPMFTQPTILADKQRLNPSDAQYVQAIYTTRYMLGASVDVGHQNFFPNGGINPQPACITPIGRSERLVPGLLACSHNLAHSYFQFALNPENVYKAKECQSMVAFNLGFCSFNPSDKMGIYSNRLNGNFYLTTTAFEPYT